MRLHGLASQSVLIGKMSAKHTQFSQKLCNMKYVK